ncbi:alpha/beta hydrolase [Lentilactobacillus fungorum]|uniref:Alpha/beta hydrolase n=1 Tax=Lentilactobacillus fungorum TaxID=2201250 RepID=A0ABQ3VYG9_9LACO|nr:alpha/beta hydrolase [Lentilactobacillus fungorum]GHP13768.1 alpha/beta hydrolase [Lentilactobacillus fungorum]
MKTLRLVLISLLIALTGLLSSCATKSSVSINASQSTPTLFFHGYGSSYHAENHMVQAAVKAGVTKAIIRADVSSTGRVTLIGRFSPTDRYPIVEVNYLNPRNPNYQADGQWAKNVIVKLQRQYHIKRFNTVAHSMGNMAVAYYLLANAKNKQLPRLQKQVTIAGHFNGILGMDDQPNRMKLRADGEPTKLNHHYRELLALRHFSALKSLQVLNIYGDKNDGSHSDGDVSNASSKSLRYLLPQVKSYQERRIVGPNAQHSKLHDNPQVNRLLIRFLWGK